MKSPAKNQDLRHFDTGLTLEERANAITEGRILKSIRALGRNWLLHPEYSGHYQPELHRKSH